MTRKSQSTIEYRVYQANRWRVEKNKAFVRLLPASLQRSLHRYYESSSERLFRELRSEGIDPKLPYWFYIPWWLEKKLHCFTKTITLPRRFLNNVCWAQYCIFLYIRILDDLFDNHVQDPVLLYIANLFLLEAEDIFSGYFPRSSQFWSAYRICIRKSITTIVEADHLQRSFCPRPRHLLSCYSDICSIFKIGALAVCHHSKSTNLLPAVNVFADEVATVGQAIDDLADLTEDLQQGRMNFVAAFLLLDKNHDKMGKKEILRGISKAIIGGNGISKLFVLLHKRIHKASHAAKLLKIPEMEQYCSSYTETLVKIEDDLYRRKVKWIFRDSILLK